MADYNIPADWQPVRVERRRHHYREEVQGISLLHVGIVAFLRDAVAFLRGLGEPPPELGPAHALQAEVVDRLREGAPLVAVTGGSGDHPAHAADRYNLARLALSLWRHGAIPAALYLNAVCDGVAQSMPGMRVSLSSRSATAEALVTQLLAHGYDALLALTSCDKHPIGVLAGAAMWARWQADYLDEPEPWMLCIPAHVLAGGRVPPDLAAEIEVLAIKARRHGHPGLADDLTFTLTQFLQCITVQAFQGAFGRLVQLGLLGDGTRDIYERRLGVAASKHTGGTCEFRGTGNTDRMSLVAYGLVPPSVQALTGPPSQAQVDDTVRLFLGLANRPEVGLRRVMHANSLNALYVHAAMSGSTNSVMHMPFVHAYLGYRSSVFDLDEAVREAAVPYLMAGFSLRADADRGFSRALPASAATASMAASTLSCCIWRKPASRSTWRRPPWLEPGRTDCSATRCACCGPTPCRRRSESLSRSPPARPAACRCSGVRQSDTPPSLRSVASPPRSYPNSMTRSRSYSFCPARRSPPTPSEPWTFCLECPVFPPRDLLRAVRRYNTPAAASQAPGGLSLFHQMVAERSLRLLIVIAGEGPLADGMPEVHKPQDWVSKNTELAPMAYLLTDARFSGTNYGPALGHAEPEALNDGIVGYLQTGNAVWARLSDRRLDLLDGGALAGGAGPQLLNEPAIQQLRAARAGEHATRMQLWSARRQAIPPAVRIPLDATTAAEGVVPPAIWEAADRNWDWRALMRQGRESARERRRE